MACELAVPIQLLALRAQPLVVPDGVAVRSTDLPGLPAHGPGAGQEPAPIDTAQYPVGDLLEALVLGVEAPQRQERLPVSPPL